MDKPIIYLIKKRGIFYTILNVIEDYESVIWTTRYDEPGEFELKIRTSLVDVSLFMLDRLLKLEKNETIMLIEKIEFSKEDKDLFIILSGRSIESYLERRAFGSWNGPGFYASADRFKWYVDMVKYSFNLSYTTGNHDLFHESIDRTVNMTVSVPESFLNKYINSKFLYSADTEERQSESTNWGKYLTTACRWLDVGYRFKLDMYETDAKSKLILEIYKGSDYSINQLANRRRVLSYEDNVVNGSFSISYERNYKTKIMFIGPYNNDFIIKENENSSYEFHVTNGYKPYCILANKDDQGNTYGNVFLKEGIVHYDVGYEDYVKQDSKGQDYIDIDSYENDMKTWAETYMEEIKNNEINSELEGTIDISTIQYDFELGDIYTIEPIRGMYYNIMINEITYAYDEEGEHISPSFTRTNEYSTVGDNILDLVTPV